MEGRIVQRKAILAVWCIKGAIELCILATLIFRRPHIFLHCPLPVVGPVTITRLQLAAPAFVLLLQSVGACVGLALRYRQDCIADCDWWYLRLNPRSAMRRWWTSMYWAYHKPTSSRTPVNAEAGSERATVGTDSSE